MNYQVCRKINYTFESLSVFTNYGDKTSILDYICKDSESYDKQSSQIAKLIAPMEAIREKIATQTAPPKDLLDLYFSNMESDRLLSLVAIIYCPLFGTEPSEIHKKYFELPTNERHQFIRNLIYMYCILPEDFPEENVKNNISANDIQQEILKSQLSQSTKLNLLTICLDIDKALSDCGEVLSKATEIFKSNEKPLYPYFEKSIKNMAEKIKSEKGLLREYIKFSENHLEPVLVHPLFMLPSSGVGFSLDIKNPFTDNINLLFLGTLYDEIHAVLDNPNDIEEKISGTLKILGDKTKQQILYALNKEPLYGQQIADLTGLTTATISYHMGLLLSNNLIYVEKRSTRLYYYLNRPRFKKYLDNISDFFKL